MTADPNELASEQEEASRNASIENHKAKQEAAPGDWDGVHCIDELCGLPIEPERLTHGFFRCFECQSTREDKIKRFGRI